MRTASVSPKPAVWKSKAGRLTFVLPLPGRTIKIYQAASSIHAGFLTRTLKDAGISSSFHTVLFSISRYVFADWVAGSPCESMETSQKYHVIDWLVNLQARLHRMHPAERDELAGFDYLDYLEKRAIRHASPPAAAQEVRQLRITAAPPPVEQSALSHPDFTLRNIVIDGESGSPRVVDNELLTQSRYFLLDVFNTIHSLRHSSELVSYYLQKYALHGPPLRLEIGWESSLAAAWSLRIAGSCFQAGLLDEGLEHIKNWDKGHEQIMDVFGRLGVRGAALQTA